MSQQQNNEPPQGQDGHPAWQEVLDSLPEELHSLVKPKLEAWDQGVQKKLQDVRSEVASEYDGYDNYRDIIEQGVDPDYLKGALTLAQQFRENPDAVIEQATQAFNLQWNKGQSNVSEPEEIDYSEDITKHPFVQQLAQQVQQLQQGYQTREQAEAEAQAQAEYEEELEALHKGPNGERIEFDDLYVTALASQGIKTTDAVAMYQKMMQDAVKNVVPNAGQQTQQQQPPVVVGGADTVAGGIPNQQVRMGDLSDTATEDLVESFLKNAAQQQE